MQIPTLVIRVNERVADVLDVQLEPHDRICLVSDGVLEQFEPSGNGQFGEERLIKSLLVAGAEAPERALSRVVDDLTSWAGAVNHFVDDVSLVIMDWLG